MIFSVIGSNYGDEGKGLITDYLSSLSPNTLVIRHNGGAQSGHTVELENKRFIFHELSSGSFRGADTYWADTYYPDLYKLSEEIDEYLMVNNCSKLNFKIFASPSTNITIIDDILLNMLYESLRGASRHGSCGMGINEADIRIKSGSGLSLGEIFCSSVDDFLLSLSKIRNTYINRRISEILEEFGYSSEDIEGTEPYEYISLLRSEDVLINFATQVHENLKFIELIESEKDFLAGYDNVIFETGQGLCLDCELEANFPHVTASKTGLHNPIIFLNRLGLKLDRAVYVTRSYLTKHGAGPFSGEDINLKFDDKTNIHNDWQGSIRFGRFRSISEIIDRISKDLSDECINVPTVSLAITHLNETNGKILLKDSSIDVADFMKHETVIKTINSFYLSDSKFSHDIKER